MPFRLMKLLPCAAADQRLAHDRRRGADDAGHGQQLRHLGVVVLDAAGLPDVDVRRRAEDAIAQLALQAGHQRQRDDQRHDADGDADRRDQRDDRDERLLAAGEQVAEGDEQLEAHASTWAASAETG